VNHRWIAVVFKFHVVQRASTLSLEERVVRVIYDLCGGRRGTVRSRFRGTYWRDCRDTNTGNLNTLRAYRADGNKRPLYDAPTEECTNTQVTRTEGFSSLSFSGWKEPREKEKRKELAENYLPATRKRKKRERKRKKENFAAAQPANCREIGGDIVERRNAIRPNFLCLFSQESADNMTDERARARVCVYFQTRSLINIAREKIAPL